MPGPEVAELVAAVAAGVGALGGGTAIGLGVRRVLSKLDGMDIALRGRPDGTGEPGLVQRMTAVENKLPNGEWKQISSDIAGLHRKFDEHTLEEEERIAQAVVRLCRNERRRVERSKRKAAARRGK